MASSRRPSKTSGACTSYSMLPRTWCPRSLSPTAGRLLAGVVLRFERRSSGSRGLVFPELQLQKAVVAAPGTSAARAYSVGGTSNGIVASTANGFGRFRPCAHRGPRRPRRIRSSAAPRGAPRPRRAATETKVAVLTATSALVGATIAPQSSWCCCGSLRPSAHFVQKALKGGDARPAQDGLPLLGARPRHTPWRAPAAHAGRAHAAHAGRAPAAGAVAGGRGGSRSSASADPCPPVGTKRAA